MRQLLAALYLSLLQLFGARAATAEAPPAPTPAAQVSGFFALEQERWDAVDALSLPLEDGRTLLVFSNRPFDRSLLAAQPRLDRSSIEIHRRSSEAVTLSLLLDARGQLLGCDYGRGAAELDSPLDYARHLQLDRFGDGWISGKVRHEWVQLEFSLPVSARVVVPSQASGIDHPAAQALQQLLTALHRGDLQSWIRLSQPADYRPTGNEAQDMRMAARMFPRLRRIESVQLDQSGRALVRMRGSSGPATAVMELEYGRWMLLQIDAAR